MSSRLELHRLPGEKRAGEVARTVERLYHDGRRVLVWLADAGRRGIMDEYLWTFRQLAFIPHVIWDGGMGSVEEPVVLVGEPANPNGATVLVIGDDPPPAAQPAGFEEIHDFIPPGDAGAERETWWAQWRTEHGG